MSSLLTPVRIKQLVLILEDQLVMLCTVAASSAVLADFPSCRLLDTVAEGGFALPAPVNENDALNMAT